jgi:hypothetical protein
VVSLVKQVSGEVAWTPPVHAPHVPFAVQSSVPAKQPGASRYEASPLKHACASPGVHAQVEST